MRLTFIFLGSFLIEDLSVSSQSLRGVHDSFPYASQPTPQLRHARNSSAPGSPRDDQVIHQENFRSIFSITEVADQALGQGQFSATMVTSTTRTGTGTGIRDLASLGLSTASTPVPLGFWKISRKMVSPLQCPLSAACVGKCQFVQIFINYIHS